ncbi:hypothetical protein [Piscinibacter sp.]|uniref:hypothetical protein n=1 Tax=Piscinibacter sp. TaxID=1903157 RepID=UPI002CD8656A|nr:hypothetical protein [Albitalea sp.]HUG26458.1 hypothetical protein [Albitalea sp.]
MNRLIEPGLPLRAGAKAGVCGVALAACFAAGAPLQAATARGAEAHVPRAIAPPDPAPSPQPVPWWLGFGDSTLNLLEQIARDRRQAQRAAGLETATSGTVPAVSDADPLIVQAYVQARVLSIRLATLRALDRACEQELALLRALPEGQAVPSSVEVLSERHKRLDAALPQLTQAAAQALRVIADQTGVAPSALEVLLAPSLADARLPRFYLGAPSRLPAHVVRARADVASLELAWVVGQRQRGHAGLDTAQPLRALDGWIDPASAATAPPATTQATPTPDIQALVAAVHDSKASVAQDLKRLQEHERAFGYLTKLIALRRTEWQTVRQRQQLGSASEAEVLERYQLMLIETDRLAVMAEEVADDWTTLNTHTAGLATVAADEAARQTIHAAP